MLFVAACMGMVAQAADRIDLRNDEIQAVINPDVGRLVHLSLTGGSNLLRRVQGVQPDRLSWLNVGGDWLWPLDQAHWPSLPQGSEWPPPRVLATMPWRVVESSEGSVVLVRQYGSPLHIVVRREYRLQGPVLVIDQSLRRTADSDIPVVLWQIAQVGQGSTVFLPVSPSVEGKVVSLMAGKNPPEPIQSMTGGQGFPVNSGAEYKLGSGAGDWVAAQSPFGALALWVDNPSGEFPDPGSHVTTYVNEGLGYVEIETLSPELPLQKGDSLANRVFLRPISPDDSTGLLRRLSDKTQRHQLFKSSSR